MGASKLRVEVFRVFYGDEDLLLDQALGTFRSKTRREILFLDGEDVEGHEVVSICETRTMSGIPRMVILDNAQKVKATAPLVKYVEGVDPEDPSVILAVVLRSRVLPAAWSKLLEKRGRASEFLMPKPWEAKDQFRRVEDQARLAGVKLGAGVTEKLIQFLGYDLGRIANELRKLSFLVGSEEVTKKHVNLLVYPVFPVEPYEVAEAAAAKDVKKAMDRIGRVYRTLGDEAGIPITYSLLRIVDQLIVARYLLDRGLSPDRVAEALEIHPYAFKMNLQPLALKHSVARLKAQMQNLCRLDALVKGPARSKRTEVELAVLSLAT